MREVVYKDYRIRYQRAKRWFAQVSPPCASRPWDTIITASLDEGPSALLALARAHIEEDIIRCGGRFLEG